jgi:hypothetical protein
MFPRNIFDLGNYGFFHEDTQFSSFDEYLGRG